MFQVGSRLRGSCGKVFFREEKTTEKGEEVHCTRVANVARDEPCRRLGEVPAAENASGGRKDKNRVKKIPERLEAGGSAKKRGRGRKSNHEDQQQESQGKIAPRPARRKGTAKLHKSGRKSKGKAQKRKGIRATTASALKATQKNLWRHQV